MNKVGCRYQISEAFAFSEPTLDAQTIIPFVNEFAMNVLVTGHPSKKILPEVISFSSTAKFTGIVHLRLAREEKVKVEHFELLHHTTRPNGKKLPPQCRQCNCYRSWNVPSKAPKKYNKILTFSCRTKGCSGVYEALPLKGYQPVSKDLKNLFKVVL